MRQKDGWYLLDIPSHSNAQEVEFLLYYGNE